MNRFLSRVRWIIGVALAVLLLSGCGSILRLSYGQGPTLAYWWLDGYLDLDGEQSARLRDDLDRWFEWHRGAELPVYADLLARAQKEVMQPVTGAAMCGWRDEAQRRLDVAVERAVPMLAALAVTLKPEQLRHLEARLAKGDAEMRADYAQADRVERSRGSFKRTLERYDNLYGRLDEAQRRSLGQLLAASPFDADRWLVERERRNAEMVRTLSAVAASGDIAQAQAAVRLLIERAQRSSRADYRAYAERLTQENCALAARMHNLMTTAQRQHARDKLKGWEEDLRELAAAPANGAGAMTGETAR
ncbi:MAG: DUF6279 family lipoprotein [Aquincola sp.]|nr:DUF6279 family lipoprotein [Aquincola sp.]